MFFSSSKTLKELDKLIIKLFTYSVNTSGLDLKLLDVHSMEDNLYVFKCRHCDFSVKTHPCHFRKTLVRIG